MADKGNNNKTPFQWSKFAGYILFMVGFLSLAELFSPIRSPAAMVVGILSMIGAVFLLIPGKMAWLKRIASNWNKAPGRMVLRDKLLPVKILRLAREKRGILTLSMVATELDVPLDEAQAALDECVLSGQATADYDMTKEVKYYKFHEHFDPAGYSED